MRPPRPSSWTRRPFAQRGARRRARTWPRRSTRATTPPIAKPHPPNDDERVPERRSIASAPRNIGSANISASVPALPAHTHVDAAGARDRRARSSPRRPAPHGRARSRRRCRPRPGGPCDEQRDRGGDEQHPVGGRVEDLAELAALVEVPGDVAVDPVGRAEDREQTGRGDRLVRAPEQPEEHGHAREAHDRDQVRDRPDARGAHRHAG